jgi:lanthanide-dependent methanol dehydrogenase
MSVFPKGKSFYERMKGKDLGTSTWPADMWKHGASSVWDCNPSPRVLDQRPGDNLWTSAIFARDVDAGDRAKEY